MPGSTKLKVAPPFRGLFLEVSIIYNKGYDILRSVLGPRMPKAATICYEPPNHQISASKVLQPWAAKGFGD